jgi:ribosome-binding protein aMBF1 (putative translation factor)
MINHDPSTTLPVQYDKNVSDFAKRLLRKIQNEPSAANVVRLEDVSNSRYHEEEKPEKGSPKETPSTEEPSGRMEPEMVKPTVNLSAQLRNAIRLSGLTRNQIAKKSGLSYSLVHGFMAATKDLQLNSASRIAGIIGLKFTELEAPGPRVRK